MGKNSPSRLKNKERVIVHCSVCGSQIEISYETFHRNGENSHNWRCRRCVMNGLSEEDKRKRSDKIKSVLGSKSKEEKNAMTVKRLHTIDTPEFREARKKKMQNTWKEKSDKELEAISKRASANTKRLWDEMDVADKDRRLNNFHNAQREWWNNLSDEEKHKFKIETSESLKEWWSSVSDEYRLAHGNKSREWYNSLPSSEKDLYKFRGKQLSDAQKKWAYNLSPTSKEEYVRIRLLGSSGTNKFHQKFERAFSESHLVNSHYIKAEYPTTNNGITHCWDYGVFDENSELIMVVDLDGVYFHADDDYDYDGIHSKMEYDIKRGQSIPNNLHHAIIREQHFDEDFQWFAHISQLSYDQFVHEEVRYLCNMPFPHPLYSDTDLVHSWNRLCWMQTNDKYHQSMRTLSHLGDHIIYHFCRSLHDEKMWSKEWIESAIRSHMIYHPHMNKNKLLLCVPHEEFTPPGQARILLKDYNDEYIDNECDVGMMLGCIASGIPYRTICTNIARYNEINSILEWISLHGVSYKISIVYEEGNE